MFRIECLYKKFFNIECPSCGMTRALKNVLCGNIKEAINNNPMILMLLLLAVTIMFRCKIVDNIIKQKLNYVIMIMLMIWLFWYLFFSKRVYWR